jgi:hypothetical protein
MSDWHYRKSGAIRDETVGPIDTETLAKRIRSGDITPRTAVSSPQKTGGKWVAVAAFPKLVEIHSEGERERERLKEVKLQRKRDAKQEKRLPSAAQQPSSRAAIYGFVTSVAGWLLLALGFFAFNPLYALASMTLFPLGFVLSCFGITRGPVGLALIGLVLSLVGILCIVGGILLSLLS